MTGFGDELMGPLTKRQFLTGIGLSAGAATLAALGSREAASATTPATASGKSYDVIIMGAGSTGMPAAIFAAERGATVLLVDKSGDIGGGIKYSGGQLAAAGTRLQKRKGIEDSPDAFYADIMRLSYGKADPVLTRLYVDHAAELVDWLEDHGHTVQAQSSHPRRRTRVLHRASLYLGAWDHGAVSRQVHRQCDDAGFRQMGRRGQDHRPVADRYRGVDPAT